MFDTLARESPLSSLLVRSYSARIPLRAAAADERIQRARAGGGSRGTHAHRSITSARSSAHPKAPAEEPVQAF